jgi:hypothetical protein
MLNAGCCKYPLRLFRAALVLLVLAFLGVSGRPSPAQPAPEPQALQLIGVIESDQFAGAVLTDSAGEQTFYRMREELPDGSRIVKMENDHIVIKRSDGTSYELFIIHDTKPSAQPPRASAAPFAPQPAVIVAPAAAPERRGGAAGGERQAIQSRSQQRSDLRRADRHNSGKARSKGIRANSGGTATGMP